MFHVTRFELFRAARGCCDFARSFTVALEKAVGRFKSMEAIALRGGAIDRFIWARIITIVMMCLCNGVYRARCLRGDVRGVRARRGTAAKDFERQGILCKRAR